MTLLAYTLTPLSRISAGRTGQVQESRSIHRVLPGAAVRGALGHTWWLSPDHAFDPTASPRSRQDAFDRLFGRAMLVRDAVPVGISELRTASMLRLKYAGTTGRHLDGHHDLAAGPLSACPACDAPFDAPRGWVRPRSGGPSAALERCPSCTAVFDLAKDGWYVPDTAEVAATRTALVDGVAQDEKLFTRASLRKQLRFRGTVVLRDGVAVPPEAVAWLRHVLEFSVGGQRSTLGRVTWTSSPWPTTAPPTGKRVVLQLRSPALLVDDRGFPSLDLEAHLARIPGAGSLACEPWLRTTQVGGWHGIAGVPKPVEWALATGSTAVLEDWSADALRVLARGLGIRQGEGYGEVALKDPADLARFGAPAAEPLFKPDPAHEASEQEQVAAPAAPAVSTSPAPDPRQAPPTPAATAPIPGPAPVTTAPPPAADHELDDRVPVLLSLLDPAQRARVLNGVLGAARNIATKRELGLPDSMIDPIVTLTLTYPWARDLGPDARRQVQVILRSPDVTDLISRIDAERNRT